MQSIAEKIPDYLVIAVGEFYEDYNEDVIIVAIKNRGIYIAMFGYCSCDTVYEETTESLTRAFQLYDGLVDDYLGSIRHDEQKKWLKDAIYDARIEM